jgi:DNA end-binding protein Ku
MPRAIWKGAISFGLVHVPVALYPASRDEEVDFDWLDKRTLDPVGYKRVNKRTGKEIHKEDIVKGVKTEGGDYVVLSDEEIAAAYPKTTQTIEIQSFVQAQDVSFVHIEKPYYLEPAARAEKVYALLREAMADSSLVGVARLVMHNKEHLAALLPAGPALMLGTLRWANEIRPADELNLPPVGAGKNGIKPAELKMAQQLVRELTTPWKPESFKDEFSEAIRTLVARKAQAGEAHAVEALEAAPDYSADNVVDLAELLRKSLGGKAAPATAGKPASKRPAKSSRREPEHAAASGRRKSG